jgi:PRTRC genetic system protein A
MEVFKSTKDARDSVETTAYVAARNGTHLFSEFGAPDGPLHFDIVKDVHPTGLDPAEKGMVVHAFTPIPMTLVSRILATFRRVYNDHHSEFIVMLEWDDENKTWAIGRPKYQTIGPAYLKYDQQSPNAGTVHSHCQMSAFFSGTDDAHEKDQPGVYLVFGSVASKKPSMVASITGCGERYTLKIPDVPDAYLDREIPDDEYNWWMETCQIKSKIEHLKYGYFMLDVEGDIACWRDLKVDLEPLVAQGDVIVAATNLSTVQTQMKSKATATHSVNAAWQERERKEEEAERCEAAGVAAPAKEGGSKETEKSVRDEKDFSDSEVNAAFSFVLKLAMKRGNLTTMLEHLLFSAGSGENEVAEMGDKIREHLDLAQKRVIFDLNHPADVGTSLEDLDDTLLDPFDRDDPDEGEEEDEEEDEDEETEEYEPRCPHCESDDILEFLQEFWCRDCQKDFKVPGFELPVCPSCKSPQITRGGSLDFVCVCQYEFTEDCIEWAVQRREEEEEEDEETVVFVHCPMCADEQDPRDGDCTNCGEPLSEDSSEQDPKGYAGECTECKKDVTVGDIQDGTCPHCGTVAGIEVDGEQVDQEPTPEDAVIGSCGECREPVTAGDIQDGGCRTCRATFGTASVAIEHEEEEKEESPEDVLKFCCMCRGSGCYRCNWKGYAKIRIEV